MITPMGNLIDIKFINSNWYPHYNGTIFKAKQSPDNPDILLAFLPREFKWHEISKSRVKIL